MNNKYLNILWSTCGILAMLIAFKIIFYFFSTPELWTIIILVAFVVIAYGIQLNTWDYQREDTKCLGLVRERIIEVYEQFTIFGIIPISKPKIRLYKREVKCELVNKMADVALDISTNVALRFLPFGGCIAPKVALKAIGYNRKSK